MRKGDPRLKFDDKAKRIEMQLERPPYIPMGVFKSFVKMALAVMPEPEASNCQHLKDWILQQTHTYESFPFRPLMLYSQFIAGPVPNDKISFMLARRKTSASGCPYLMFMIQYGNHVHQIALPMPKEDGMGQYRHPLATFRTPGKAWITLRRTGRLGLLQKTCRRRISEEMSRIPCTSALRRL